MSGWLELRKHVMTHEVARALVAAGLAAGEALEHVSWGGELPTWAGMRNGVLRIASAAASDAKALRPEQAVGAVVEAGAAFALVAGLTVLGADNAEDVLDLGASPRPPTASRFGFLLASTSTRLVLLEVQRCVVDPPRGRSGIRTLVSVHSAYWWTRPIAASVPLRMREQRVLWRQTIVLSFRDDGRERRLSFPTQPGMAANLEEARAIAASCLASAK